MAGRAEGGPWLGPRSALFHAASAAVTLIYLPACVLLLAPARVGWPVLKSFVRVQVWLLRVVCGQRYRVEGGGNLPAGAAILAARHEAMWETLVLPVLLDNPAVILKQEILRYPVAGPVARKMGYLGIDRAGDAASVKATFEAAARAAQAGRRVLIFPSGTRNPAHRDRVQGGVAILYRRLGLACVPVTHDSGDYWPYRSWLRRPGTITVRVSPPIPPGLRTAEFTARLQAALARPA